MCDAVFGDYQPATLRRPRSHESLHWRPPRPAGRTTSSHLRHRPPVGRLRRNLGIYLDMWEVLTTMHHHLPGLATDPKTLPVEADSPKPTNKLGVFFNEVNRTMGLKDLVPEVISDEAVKKLAFIHQLISGAKRRSETELRSSIMDLLISASD